MKRWASQSGKPFTWLKEKLGRDHAANTHPRLTHQLILTFAVVVLVPLLGVSFIIYSINQTALRKELLKFTEHTAETIYKDFNTEMGWQQEQSQMMAFYLLDDITGSLQHKQSLPTAFSHAAQGVFKLSSDTEAVGLYDADGHPIQRAYRHTADMPEALKLPDTLGNRERYKTRNGQYVYDVVYEPHHLMHANNAPAIRTPYFLRVVVPIQAPQAMSSSKPAYYVQLKPFRYLAALIQDHSAIYESFYIIDDRGYVIAGPNRQDILKTHISNEDLRYFKSITAGVTHELANSQPTIPEATEKGKSNKATLTSDEDNDEAPPLEKVVVKMPDTNWGIIIESPYHVRQKYIKRAHEQSMLLIVACLILTVLLALVYIYGINRNFRQLIKGINAMAEGNYFRRIRLITNLFTPYEIVYLTNEFNRMAKRRAEAWETLEKANQQLAKLDDLKSNLIDTVSHELRTPLTNIKGYTSRLLRYDDTLDKETRIKSLKTVKQQADRLSRLVDDLLVIPELEKTSLRIFPDAVLLPELIERCVHFTQAKDQREINVTYDMALPAELMVLADPDRLEQILLNLLDNAVKYSIPDTPLSVAIQPMGTDAIQVKVSNASDPLSDAALATLFNKFQRLDDSMVRTTRGSGLGLFITKGLVEAMSGHISVHFADTQFHIQFTLPVYENEIATRSPNI